MGRKKKEPAVIAPTRTVTEPTLYPSIAQSLRADPLNLSIIDDMIAHIRNCNDHTCTLDAIERINDCMSLAAARRRYDLAESIRDRLFRLMCYDAPVHFDIYLQALEFDRPPEQRFYLPRRRVMLELVNALQDLADDNLDELILSMPPRVGKTTLLLFFMSWIIGRNSEGSNLYVSYSDIITSAFYNGLLEILNDPTTYHWREIFDTCVVAGTNANEETIDIDRRKRYHSFTSRSLYGTLNGACDCSLVLVSDDLIGSIEEALNPDRLTNAWSKVDNNMIPRKKEHAKLLWCGTRWSIADPTGRRISLLENDPEYESTRYKIINLPALDSHDESNFDYDYGVGFSTEYYRQRRASFEHNNDAASWLAQYMGEPIEREGALFTPDTMRYYNGTLPDEEPDRVFMAVDPAYGGGDFTASPVCYQYGTDIYVADVVFSTGDKTITQPMLAAMAARHGVGYMRMEGNKSTLGYAEGLEKCLDNIGYHLTIEKRPASNQQSKETRIFDKAPDIREHFIFLEPGRRSPEYNQFMTNVYGFKIMGKNKHDDAPDSLAMASDILTNGTVRRIQAIRRPF